MKSVTCNLFALAVLALAMTPSLAFGQNNTGTAGCCGLAFLDPYYTLVAAPPPLTRSPLFPCPVYSTKANPAWVPASPGSNWINHDGFDNPSAPGGHIDYDYETMFTFPAYVGPVSLEGVFAADNDACLWAPFAINRVRCTLNGVNGDEGFKQYTHFVIPASDLIGGTTNTLDFVVNNESGPTGLEVEFFCPFAEDTLGIPTGGGVYEDGLFMASLDAWSIFTPYAVSDTFFTSHAHKITGFCFGAWVEPLTAVPNTVDWSITDSANAPCPSELCLGNGTATLSCDLYCASGDKLFPPSPRTCGLSLANVYACTASIPDVGVPAGVTLWPNLTNATTTPGGGFVFWDQNIGLGCNSPQCPSLASQNTTGTIPSEMFVLYG